MRFKWRAESDTWLAVTEVHNHQNGSMVTARLFKKIDANFVPVIHVPHEEEELTPDFFIGKHPRQRKLEKQVQQYDEELGPWGPDV